ncbi:MAG: DUF2079 domain-containing protein [Elusimicrobia bacterium]|nr:DUF2079 domain-containing protein [Elusimicrobiota bacterium]
MAKKHKPKEQPSVQAPSSAKIFWLPTFVLAAIPAYVIVESMQAHDFAHRAYFVQNDLLNSLSWMCFALAVLLAVFPPLRRLAHEHLDSLGQATLSARLSWLGAGFLGVFVWFNFIRYCQYRAFLLPQDTTCNVNTAYTFLHHGVLEWPIWGMKVFSLHFIYQWAVFSPFLLIKNSPVTLLFVQNFFICSAPFAAYALAVRLTRSPAAGFVGMILTLSTPYLYELLTSNLHNAALCAFLPWMMYFLYQGRWALVGFLVFLMIGSVEQVPFIFAGLGLYAIYALRERVPRNWVIGLSVTAAAGALFVFEQAVKKHYASLEGISHFMGAGQWELLRAMVPAGTPEAEIPKQMLSHPFRTMGMMLSLYKYFPVLRVLFSMGLFPLLAPFELIPFLTTVLPQVLAAPPAKAPFFNYHPITYHDFGLHHGAYIFGPLVFATAHGIMKARERLAARGWQSWLLVWAFAVSGVGFKYAHRTLNPNWREPWFDAMPALIERIPPQARVWVDEYASAHLSARRWIKVIQWGPDEPYGYHKLFKPDYVLFSKAFAAYAKPPFRDKMLQFFADNGYVKDAERADAVLLKAPQLSLDPESVPAWVPLPDKIDPKKVEAFAQYLLAPAP